MVLYWPNNRNGQKSINRFNPAFFSELLGPSSGTFSVHSCSVGKIGNDQCAGG